MIRIFIPIAIVCCILVFGDKNAKEMDSGIMWNNLHCVDESPLLPSQFCNGRSDCGNTDNIGNKQL